MVIKAVAVDYDWTLTNDKGVIVPGAIESLKKAEESGFPVMIATARTLINVEAKISRYEISASGPIISENGGVVKDQISGKEVVLGSLEKAEEAYTILKKNVKGLKRQRQMKLPHHTIRKTDVVLIVNKKDLSAIDREMKNIRVNVDYTYALTPRRPGRIIVFIKKTGVDKGAGLKIASEMLGIKTSEVAVIGDSENDIKMFEAAGFSYAVGNADERLKQRANVVVHGKYGEGVSEAIDRILNSPCEKT
jgi:phosphoglycolate phosphatase (TIGR01487 family)